MEILTREKCLARLKWQECILGKIVKDAKCLNSNKSHILTFYKSTVSFLAKSMVNVEKSEHLIFTQWPKKNCGLHFLKRYLQQCLESVLSDKSHFLNMCE